MNQYLKTIQDLIQQNNLAQQDKEALLKAITDADKQWTITDFKLDRTEKVKKTTAILLEETIDELENKRKAIEAQNRELEIESALERVRAVALSMMKPADMLEVCKVISSQLEFLKVKDVRNVQTAIFYESRGIYVNYEFYARHNKELITEVEYANHPVSQNFAERMLKGSKQVWMYSFKGQEVKDWLTYQKGTNVFIDTYLENADTLNYYWYSLGPVGIGMSSYTPLQEEEIELFKRFRNVFELAYRRYLDIEKAEAQATEANIEAALEKVRSKANAMHHSEGLRDVIKEVHSQLRHLEFRFDSADFLTDYTDKGYNIWLATVDPTIPSPIFVPYFNHRIFHLLNEEVRQGHDFFTFRLTQEEKDQYFRHVFETALAQYEHQESREFVLNAKGMATSCVVLKNIILSITNFASIPYTEEENNIIKRFAYVFEQSYIRFLDLKNAEAQARESQIQLALERVRARTMAMQRSEELLEVVAEVFKQMQTLGFNLNLCNIVLFDTSTLEADYWLSGGEQTSLPEKYHIPYFDHPLYQYQLDAWKNAKPFAIFELEGELRRSWNEILYTKTDIKRIPASAKEMMDQLDKLVLSSVATKHGLLQVIGTEQLSNEYASVLGRFAKVFEQTYTRFLDLQNAEAQARESQIQLALERVRARTMAMHSSNELAEVAALLFEQVKHLGIETYASGFNIWDKNHENLVSWMSNPTGSINPPFEMPIHTYDQHERIYKSWKDGESFIEDDLTGEALVRHYKFLRPFRLLDEAFSRSELAGIKTPDRQVHNNAHFSNGYLLFAGALGNLNHMECI